jgi:diguanylate cyclase (GGDEF)-like protein/PAS domain S-box-containing protein
MPEHEVDRLKALQLCGVLDTPSDPQYDGITRLAAVICGTPIALVTLLDTHRQWFKSRFGLQTSETPRSLSFCAHAIMTSGLFVVTDAAVDPRFRNNPLVTGEPHIRFYAGIPLTDPDGHCLGTLCVIDRVPRELTASQREALTVLSGQVMVLLESDRQAARLKQAQARLPREEERFRAFMDESPAVASMKDDAGRFVYVNESLVRSFGMPKERWLGRTDADIWGEQIARTLQETDRHVLVTGETVSLYETVSTPGGNATHWRTFKFRFTDASGHHFLAGIAVDRTAEKLAADALQVSEEKFCTVVNGLAEGVLLIDTESKAVLESNVAAKQLFGYSAAELFGLTLYDLCTHDRASVDADCERITRLSRCTIGRQRYRHKDGSLLDLELSASLVGYGGRRVIDIVFRDVGEAVRTEARLEMYRTELGRENAQLRELAATDGLTGVKNRAGFDARLADAYDLAVRHGHPLSVVFLDVDHFKLFNDAFGHPAGDEVLKTVAATIAGAARTTDTVARYGGEEFVVVLPETDYEGAMILAERCRLAVAGAAWEHRPVTVSVGVSTLTAETQDASVLVREADEALYRSKQSGRNRVNHGSGTVPLKATMR